MAHVFISYMRADQDVVDRLVAVLRHHGINVWLDRTHIKPGQRWQQAIRTAIKQGAFFLICFSKAYYARSSTHTNEELVLAIDELRRRPTDRTWFIPIVLDNVAVPERAIGGGELLTDLQHVDLSGDWSSEIRKLIATLGVAPSHQPTSLESTSLGLVDAAPRYQSDPQQLLAGLELSRLEATWTFPKVPERVAKLVDVCFATVDNEWYRDDQLGRNYSRPDQQHLRQGLATEYVLRPILHAIANPDFEVQSLFDDEIDERAMEDVQEAGFWAQYTGPRHVPYLPLGVDGSAVLALGEIEDDSTPIPDDPNDIRTPIDGSEKFFAEYTRHRFSTDFGVNHDGSLCLSFVYGPESLHRAVGRAYPSQRISSLFPKTFNIVIANKKFDRSTYFANLGRKFSLASPEVSSINFRRDVSDRSPIENQWTFRSELVLTTNSLTDFHLRYSVTCLGFGVSVDELPLGDTSDAFEYVLFKCERTWT